MIAGTGESTLDGAPVAGRHARELVVAEVRLEVHDGAERARLDQALDLDQRRLEAALVADPEHEAAPSTRLHHLPGVGGGQRERLLAEHVLAGGGSGQDLRVVQRVRRREDHRLELRIGKRLVQARGQGQPVLGRERPGRLGPDVDRTDHTQLL